MNVGGHMETFTKLGNIHKNEQKMNKVDRIRKEAHFFLLENNYKANTSSMSVLIRILENRGFFYWNMVFQNVRRGMWVNENVRHKYFVTRYNKTWMLEVTWKHSQKDETNIKMSKRQWD